MRVAIPPANLRSPEPTLGCSQQRRGPWRHGHQRGHSAGWDRHQPIRKWLFSGTQRGSSRGCIRLHWGLWQRGLPGLRWGPLGRPNHWCQLQRKWHQCQKIFVARIVWPNDLVLFYASITQTSARVYLVLTRDIHSFICLFSVLNKFYFLIILLYTIFPLFSLY